MRIDIVLIVELKILVIVGGLSLDLRFKLKIFVVPGVRVTGRFFLFLKLRQFVLDLLL